MLPWVYGSGPAPEALRGEDDDGVLNTAADQDVMVSLSGVDVHQQVGGVFIVLDGVICRSFEVNLYGVSYRKRTEALSS